jgi:hypothetical protein
MCAKPAQETSKMLNQRLAAAQKVAAHLLPTEHNLQGTMLQNLKLQVAIMEARDEARVGKNVGAVALLHLADAQRGLAVAWKSMTDAHGALHEDQRLAGLGAVSFGDADTSPTGQQPEEEMSLLRVA